jgi:flavin reductase (DIM6/NTAB) family NADH-FMN oxidoreductase RutF
MAEHAEGVFHSESTKEALELMPTGLFLLTAAHNGEDNWQFVQRGLGITAGPPTIVVVVLSPRNKTTELVDGSGEFGLAVCSPHHADFVDRSRGMSGHKTEDKFADMGIERLPAKRISAPLVAGSFVNMECVVRDKLPIGDRIMYISEVLELYHDPTTEPLIHYERKVYRFLQDEPIG